MPTELRTVTRDVSCTFNKLNSSTQGPIIVDLDAEQDCDSTEQRCA